VAAAATAGDAPAASPAQSRYKAALWRVPADAAVEWAPLTTHEAHLGARLCGEDGGLPLLRYRLAVGVKGHGGAIV